jgi:hypothetical protein
MENIVIFRSYKEIKVVYLIYGCMIMRAVS